MKKFLSLAAALLLVGACSVPVLAEDTAEVYVTIADANGDLVLAQEAVTVTDTDNDGALTIHDALYAAHEANYDGGAAAGYDAGVSDYGLSMNKLWGAENGGSYGYYLNNASAWSLLDPVKDGDYINAFVYTDLTAWSDTYCYFDVQTITADAGSTVTLTLSAAGYDADYNPITVPVENAVITVNGETTAYQTDADGKVTITLDKVGTVTVSAASDSQTLVPPVCKVVVSETVVETAPQTGDNAAVLLLTTALCGTALCGTVLCGSLAVGMISRKKTYEK